MGEFDEIAWQKWINKNKERSNTTDAGRLGWIGCDRPWKLLPKRSAARRSRLENKGEQHISGHRYG